MGAFKINIMTIISILTLIMGIIALGCYEGSNPMRHAYQDFYEAAVIIGIVFALVVLIIVLLDKPEAMVGRVYLMFGLASLILLVALILICILHSRDHTVIREPNDVLIASYVFGAFEFIGCIAGTIMPFLCGK